ncbi:TrmB family transcriptional regulator [Streptomyces sp. NRRL B-24484]|uniref:TrmB family transcriptional regulator n=1 Tax=Streptomyces sp. NRRL B-24484 TaxID=1463833 RepID=UPI0006935C31|nr:helix-turn-helix domain-containing protein [Streptomyces sp. NRRL B-24484]
MSETDEPGLTPRGLGVLSSEARQLYRNVLKSHGRLSPDLEAPEGSKALDELLDIGLLVPDTDDPAVLVAVDPEQLSARLTSLWQRKALDLLHRAVALPADLQDLAEDFRTPRKAGGIIEYVHGKVLINQRLGQLVSGCSEEMLAAQPGGPRPPEALAGVIARDLETLRRGATIRTIYHPSTRYHAPTRDYVASITTAGGRVRTLDEPYTRLIVIDRRTAVIPVVDDLNLAAFIHDQAVISYLIEEVFERNWSRALDFDGSPTVPPQVVSRLRQTIIDLMLKGINHRVIARRLGISERTLARHIAEMREDYQVESLFQLGWVLARSAKESPTDQADFG